MLLSGGCIPSRISLELSDRVSAPIEGGRGQQIVVVEPFRDERSVSDRCGALVGGFSRVGGTIFCAGEPAAWISKLLRKQLRRSGFDVVEEADATSDAIRVEGSLLKLFVEVRDMWSTIPVRIEGDIHVRLIASSPVGLEARRDFYVKRRSVFADRRIAGPYRAALNRAAESLLSEMNVALIQLAERYSGDARR